MVLRNIALNPLFIEAVGEDQKLKKKIMKCLNENELFIILISKCTMTNWGIKIYIFYFEGETDSSGMEILYFLALNKTTSERYWFIFRFVKDSSQEKNKFSEELSVHINTKTDSYFKHISNKTKDFKDICINNFILI